MVTQYYVAAGADSSLEILVTMVQPAHASMFKAVHRQMKHNMLGAAAFLERSSPVVAGYGTSQEPSTTAFLERMRDECFKSGHQMTNSDASKPLIAMHNM